MKKDIEPYKDCLAQIASPYSTGTGFFLREHEFIITNEHIVRGNREVIVAGPSMTGQLAKVLYSDAKFDLAFLQAPANASLASLKMAEHFDLKAGDFVTVVGHSFGMKFTSSEGRILNPKIREEGLDYILHDSVLQTGNKGGVLLNESGEVIGMNTFQYPSPEKGSFSLPVHYLIDTLEAFQKGKGLAGVRCQGCHQLVFENTARQGSCPFCGSKIILPPDEEEYEARGIARTIEEILEKSGHNVRLARRGPNFWEIRQGSALICITYYEPNGLIAGDAVLCNLPKEKNKSVFEFLLRQNFEMEGLTFNIKGPEILLSLIIFDRYLNTGTGLKLFKYLFDKADYFDNILVEKFGALWKERNL